MSEVHVRGLSELQAFLDQLPAKLEANVMRGTLRAGAKLIEAQAKATVPVGPPSSEGKRLYGGYAGALRDSIRVTTSIKGATVYAHIKVGGKMKNGADVFYAHIIEGFWREHRSTPYAISAFKKGGMLSFGGIFRKTVMHPPIQAHPFLRPALDAQAQPAVIAAAEYMKGRLATREGLDTSAVLIEGDQ